MTSTLKQASLLGLPPELRLQIYEAAFPGLVSKRGVYVHAIGTLGDIPYERSKMSMTYGPWALLRSCRLIFHEMSDLVAPVKAAGFVLENMTDAEVDHWLDTFGEESVAKMSRLEICGWSEYYRSEGWDIYYMSDGWQKLALELEVGSESWWRRLGYRSDEWALRPAEHPEGPWRIVSPFALPERDLAGMIQSVLSCMHRR